MNPSRSLLAVLAFAVVVLLAARIGSGEQRGAPAPTGQGAGLPTIPSVPSEAAYSRPLAHSAFQAAVKSVAEHDPTGAVWQLYDRCVVLPDARAYRDRVTSELNAGAHEAFRPVLELKVGQADTLLAAPYADLCLDAFTSAAANPVARAESAAVVP